MSVVLIKVEVRSLSSSEIYVWLKCFLSILVLSLSFQSSIFLFVFFSPLLLQHLFLEVHLITQIFYRLFLVLVPLIHFLNLRQRDGKKLSSLILACIHDSETYIFSFFGGQTKRPRETSVISQTTGFAWNDSSVLWECL